MVSPSNGISSLLRPPYYIIGTAPSQQAKKKVIACKRRICLLDCEGGVGMKRIHRFIGLVVIILLGGAFWLQAQADSLFLNNGFQALFYHSLRIEESFPSLNPLGASLEEFQKALREKEEAGEANLMIGLIYHYLERPGTALGYYLDLARLHPEETWINSLVGDLYLEMGRTNEAEAFYEKALSGPEEHYAQAYFGLGRIALEQEDYPKAREAFELALTDSTDFVDARLGLGRTLYHLEDYQGAIEVLEQAQLQAPRHAPIAYYLSLSYAGAGRREQAQHALERFEELTAAAGPQRP